MTEEQEKCFKECIKSIPPRKHETPESADKSILDAYKDKQKAKIDEEDEKINNNQALKLLEKIGKELNGINRELNALNKNLRKRG